MMTYLMWPIGIKLVFKHIDARILVKLTEPRLLQMSTSMQNEAPAAMS